MCVCVFVCVLFLIIMVIVMTRQAGHIDTTVIKLKGCVHWDKANDACTTRVLVSSVIDASLHCSGHTFTVHTVAPG